jgi:hypothetical protein
MDGNICFRRQVGCESLRRPARTSSGAAGSSPVARRASAACLFPEENHVLKKMYRYFQKN